MSNLTALYHCAFLVHLGEPVSGVLSNQPYVLRSLPDEFGVMELEQLSVVGPPDLPESALTFKRTGTLHFLYINWVISLTPVAGGTIQ